jgi:anaerobic selenocysteine-containing dehydrogenase
MEEFVTACPRNCYSTCSFKVQVENNKIRRILPYAGNLATPEGPCIKGLSYIERTHSSDRIISPLLKTSKGSFEKISIDVALGIISSRLESLRQTYGPHSILWYRGSGMSGLTNEIGSEFWRAFGGATTTYGNLCWPAGLEAVRLTMGSVKHNVPWDLENAKTIIIWGKNPAETNIQEIAFISRARERGSRVIVIDPLRTPTADKADMLFCPESGTDAALALAIAWVIANENMVDMTFISDHVKGFDEFTKSLHISPTDAEKITGIPAKDIIELAYIIAKGGPVTFLPGYGLQRHKNGGQTIRSILSLAVITGSIGKKGAGFNFANLQSYIYDDVKEPLSYYPDPKNDFPFRRSVSMARLGADMQLLCNPELKAAWIERGNPVLQSPDTHSVIKAFRRLEFKVVIEQFMTDTAREADIILPAKDMFEQSDIIGSYWSPYVQFKPKVIESPGEVMPETEIYFHIARRLNMEIADNLIPEPGNQNIEKWLERRISCYDITLEKLKNGPVLPPQLQTIAWEDMKFDTPSGKIELYSSQAQSLWRVSPLPDFIKIVDDDSNIIYPLRFITPNTGSRIHSQFGNLKIIKESVPGPSVLISPYDALKRKVISGQKIRVFNQKGEIFSVAKISNRIPQGYIVLPNGIWIDEGGGGNTLIDGVETDMGYGAAFHDNTVEVEVVIQT